MTKYFCFFGNIYEYVQHLIPCFFLMEMAVNVANPQTRISFSMFLQVTVACWSSATVVSPHQRFSGSEELGEEELESVSSSAVGGTKEASGESLSV